MTDPSQQLDLQAVDGGPIGVMICGHGSRNKQAVTEFAQFQTSAIRAYSLALL